jgi:uncharacterized protein YodC (DUF2158 family)
MDMIEKAANPTPPHDDTAPATFKVGDVVELNSGSPAMTVINLNTSSTSEIEVTMWRDGKFVTIDDIKPACLRPSQRRAPESTSSILSELFGAPRKAT